jgi:hypothetical protein
VRWLALYLRSRQVAVGVAVAVAAAVGIGLLGDDNDQPGVMLTVFAITVVCAVTASGLAGPDPALERTAAWRWWGRRVAHVVAIGALAVVLGVTAGPPVATGMVVRDAIGLTGLAALGAAVLGSGLAWVVPLVWSVVAVSAFMGNEVAPAPVVTWPVQPAGTTAATIAAAVLGLAGLLVYAVRGPRAAQ